MTVDRCPWANSLSEHCTLELGHHGNHRPSLPSDDGRLPAPFVTPALIERVASALYAELGRGTPWGDVLPAVKRMYRHAADTAIGLTEDRG